MRRTCLIFLLISCAHSAFSQATDTLRQVSKSAYRPALRLSASLRNNVVLDSAVLAYYSQESLTSLLAQQSYSFVRQYGTNGPATLLLRGASAAQTAVRWNGVPIQNGATGIVDLSLIPVAALNRVTVATGSAGSYEGSGAVGGVLYLNSPQASFDDTRSGAASLAGGSFSNYVVSGKAMLSSRKWAGYVGIQHQQAENDFEYTDQFGHAVRLDNAKIKGQNIQAGLAGKLSQKDVLTLSLWANRYRREIPPALFESYSVKESKDAGFKSALSWQRSNTGSAFGATASVINDWFEYRDSAIALLSKYETRQLYGNFWARKFLPHHIVLEAQVPVQCNYFIGGEGREISRAALVAAGTKSFFQGLHDTGISGSPIQAARATISLNGRAEAIEDKTIFLGDFSAAFALTASFSLRAAVGNTYRYPTLNERYYFPGGNKNLKPETGWSTEAGYDWKPGRGKAAITFAHSATVYYRDIKDWIIWFGGAVWTPHNIAEVVSKGIETNNKLSWRRSRIVYHVSAGGSAVSSATVRSAVPGDGSIGHQIPYAPRLVAQGNIGFNTAAWRFNYNQTYTADRYYNSDETGLLQAYATGNMQAGWLCRHKSWSLDVAATLQNMWDARYAEVSGRPAMGRNFLLSCTVAYFK